MNEQSISTRRGSEPKNVLSFPQIDGPSVSAAHTVVDEIALDGIPSGYFLSVDGIYQLRSGKDEDLVPVRISSPLVVKGKCRRHDGGGWGRVVAVEDPDGKWHEQILEARDLSKRSTTAMRSLFDHGLELAPSDKAAESLADLIAVWRPETRYLRSDRLGWTDGKFNAFTLGDGRVLGDSLVVTDSIADDVAAAMHTQGTLNDWRSEVAAPCVDNPLMIFALSHAFSGPLLAVLGRDGGGFHLRGASSRGKSTLLGVAASVWGAPSFVQSWRGTDNAFEAIAATCNDSLLVLDELHLVEPRVVGEIVYMLANGRGKMRTRSNGKVQKTQRWSVPVLSSGEISLEAHMMSGGRVMHAGQDIRLIDLVADVRPHGAFDSLHGERDGRAFAEKMQRAAQENYGLAGPVFVKNLMANIGKRDLLRRKIDVFCRSCEAKSQLPMDGQVQRTLVRFGIAALAGEMATKFGLTGWQPGTAVLAAHEIFTNWFETRDQATLAEISAAVDRTRAYVEKNMDRFLVLGTPGGNPLDGWRDSDWLYIRPECWKLIHGAENSVDSARLHQTAGQLRTHKGCGLQFKMTREVPDRPKVYAVRASAFLSAA